nr:hypothetical protein [Nocardioides aquaticus]
MAADLAGDVGDREGQQVLTAVGVVGGHGPDQGEVGDLGEVLQGDAALGVAPGDGLGDLHVELDHGVQQAVALHRVATVGRRGGGREQLGGARRAFRRGDAPGAALVREIDAVHDPGLSVGHRPVRVVLNLVQPCLHKVAQTYGVSQPRRIFHLSG